jgi:hypothetical protein
VELLRQRCQQDRVIQAGNTGGAIAFHAPHRSLPGLG